MAKHLYETFQPTHYDLYINVDRANKLITGKTTIAGTAQEATIAVNQKFLTIESVAANDAAVPFTVDDDNERLEITLPQAGDVTLTIAYTAPLTDTMMGIYPSYYTLNGEKQELIGTQFESTAARQAFPGVDEPEAKATFDLAIQFDEQSGETIIANMPETKVEDGVHYFATTMRMSTYLIAFAFGDMQKKLTQTKSGVEIGVFATKAHQPKELDFALDIAKHAIEFYEDFYQTPYPLPHSYQLALPDFSAGAMENWGLVTYREAYLTLDPDNTSLSMKQLAATVITHELAHQWFGDLVTMKWWDDLWLNESFANMMEYLSVDALEPDWHIWELFQESEASSALRRDATDGVQSVHVSVEDPADIDSVFDGAIVYAKGSRMLVMVRALLGDDNLRKGLKAYFDAHKFGNATGADLWAALGDASGLDVGAIMNSWLEQPGYPLVSASVENGDLVISQQQFFIGEGKEVGRQWQIPLESNYAAAPQLMTEKSLNLGNYEALRNEAGQAFRLNVGNNSHFIVKYDDTLMADILKEAADFDPISQLQLLQDARLQAEAGVISYAEIVPLLTRFAGSAHSVVNTALNQAISGLGKFTTPGSDEENQLKALYAKIFGQQYARLGLVPQSTDTNDDQLSRETVVGSVVFADDAKVIEDAHALYLAHAANLDAMPADPRPYVLISEAKHFGDQALLDSFFAAYRKTSDPSVKKSLMAAVPRLTDPELLKQVVAHFEDADTIKPQDLRAWFRGVLNNPAGEQLAWDWIRSEWGWLEKTVGGDMEFTTYITVISGIFRTQERLDEFSAFFDPKKDVPGLGREITMDTKVIATRVALIAKEQAAVNAAIKAAL
ncbi:M1 family metallopeptidase [Lacticaseibacillus mingshuiensis]|uniref:M1 family metallopeptidase n=1 Tax=Lacticaseibacillus mingshuiensis TaxID=2799574 RepID=UPI001952133B|nr:M1 family metallopeptidase [Lacticaseibacillus mingshuiensis]